MSAHSIAAAVGCRLLTKSNLIGMLVGSMLITPFVVMLFDRRAPVTLTGGVIIPHEAVPGEMIRIEWNANEHRACDGEFSRIVIDSTGRYFEFAREATIYRQTLNKERTKFSREFVLPRGMAPGPALYFVSGYRWCNVMQKYIWPIPFTGPMIKFVVKNVEGQNPQTLLQDQRHPLSRPGDRGVKPAMRILTER